MATFVNDEDFNEQVLESTVPVLVDFFATWCGPCHMIAPAIEEISAEMEGRAKVVKVDVDQSSSIAVKYGVKSVPTLMFFKNGEVVDQVLGAVPKDFIEKKMNSILL